MEGCGWAGCGIAFERQLVRRAERMCGAAALAMVYRALGVATTQEMIWEQIARRDDRGNRAARTYLLAQNALRHGLSAVVVQAEKPWATLRALAAEPIGAILNHRLRPDSPLGHYSVLVGVDDDAVILHDPEKGPNRRLPHDDLLRLWQPTLNGSEIASHVLVAIGERESDPAVCPACLTEIPAAIPCPACGANIPLRPVAPLGCADRSCTSRLWAHVFCPYCDRRLGEVGTACQGAPISAV